MRKSTYDLEERLLAFAANVIHLIDELPATRTGNHIAGQLVRAATSPLANHGEAQAAESRADFVHKLRICLKELRETSRWLRLIARISLVPASTEVEQLWDETSELIRIFAKSIRTAEADVRKRG